MENNEKLYFWSTIMRDHSEFFLLTLSSRESSYIEKSNMFKNIFIQIGNDIQRQGFTLSDEYINNIYSIEVNFINLKQEILSKLLTGNIEINLPPTFINHMINEAMEFLETLQKIKTNSRINLVTENINLHKIWLPDASGHAVSIASNLDPTETFAINEAKEFQREFNCLYNKSNELGTMLERTGLNNGNLEYLNEEVIDRINAFIVYLNKVMVLRTQNKLLGNLNSLLPDHMIREEQYYLENIKSIKY